MVVIDIPRLARAVRHFVAWRASEQLLLPVVWLVLGFSRLLIVALPFRNFAPWLGASLGASPWLQLLSSGTETRAASIGKVVRVAARYTPWQSNCLPQAMTAAVLLRFFAIPYSFFLGVARTPNQLTAHAWVAAGRVQVTGGAGFGEFSVVCCFAHNPAPSAAPSSPNAPSNKLG